MSQNAKGDSGHTDTAADEIEIVEVVGLDEDAPPGSAREEVEILFENGDAAQRPPRRAVREPETDAQEQDGLARERFLRLRADFENFQKRVEREREEHTRRATAALLVRLLPILDNFERALATKGQAGNGEESLRQGVGLIHRQLGEELRREGLEAVEARGLPFDPNVHEAVATESDSGLPPGTVIDELQRGYSFRGLLLRPAMVRVQTDESHAPNGSGGDQES